MIKVLQIIEVCGIEYADCETSYGTAIFLLSEINLKNALEKCGLPQDKINEIMNLADLYAVDLAKESEVD